MSSGSNTSSHHSNSSSLTIKFITDQLSHSLKVLLSALQLDFFYVMKMNIFIICTCGNYLIIMNCEANICHHICQYCINVVLKMMACWYFRVTSKQVLIPFNFILFLYSFLPGQFDALLQLFLHLLMDYRSHLNQFYKERKRRKRIN